jgi:hypothetical protein
MKNTDNNIHSFSLIIANQLGLNEAIMMQNLYFLIPTNNILEIDLKSIHKKIPYFTTRQIELMLKKLQKIQYINIKKYTDIDVFNILNIQNCKTGCLFCGYNKCYLDKHHYPIRAKNNGYKTINLCPNCHREFHFLADLTYIISLEYNAIQILNNNIIL